MREVYAVAGVSKQAHHQYLQDSSSKELLLSSLISDVDLIRKEHPGCGLEKLYLILQPKGIGRDRFISAFQGLGYGVIRQKNYHRTTIPTHIKFPNLITGMILSRANQLWQSDITYLYVSDRYYYLTFIIDAYTKVIKGYSVSDHMRAEANIEALKRAFKNSSGPIAGLIHHSDRGSQYVDKMYQGLLTTNGIYISMGMQAQDNAYAERINGTIKNEYLKYRTIKSYVDLKKQVKKEVDHYNEKRPHNSLPHRLSPKQFEKEVLHWQDKDKPIVVVYSEGNSKVKRELNPIELRSRLESTKPACPIDIS